VKKAVFAFGTMAQRNPHPAADPNEKLHTLPVSVSSPRCSHRYVVRYKGPARLKRQISEIEGEEPAPSIDVIGKSDQSDPTSEETLFHAEAIG